ncbi:MAG: nitrogen regulation protein NR(I) [Pseudomonadota bacterium]
MTNADLVWIVDDDRSIRWVLERALERQSIPCRSFPSAEDAMQALATQRPAVVLTDVRMPGMDGFEFLRELEERETCPVIMMTAHSDLDSAVTSYQGGAFEYLPKPFDVDEAVAVVERARAHSNDVAPAAANDEESGLAQAGIIGQSAAMQDVYRAIGRLSHSSITVLINGESGSGKELVARALHTHSPRRDGPFVALNMAAIPHELIESELFGHEKGAFTGATNQRIGRFEQADSGTLFLDEIGDMPAAMQTRLLRVLEDGSFYKVGGRTAQSVDVRVIAATHQNLERRVAEGDFREDLFHRLNVIRLQLPRLTDRPADIPLLARHFLDQAAQELGGDPKTLSAGAEAHLCAMPWPGNVRQLENTCRWLTVMASGREIQVEDLPEELRRETAQPTQANSWDKALARWAQGALPGASAERPLLDEALPLFERTMIETTLAHTNGRKRDAAVLLGWGRNTLTRKLKELGMSSAED